MSVSKQFIEHLKNEQILEAIQVIKDALDESARIAVSGVYSEVAESFKMKNIKVDESDDEDDEDKSDDSEDDDKSDDDDDSEDEDEKED